jgi:hypothetical protein
MPNGNGNQYPEPNPLSLLGDTMTINRFVNSPVLIQRTVENLVLQNLIGGLLLPARYNLTGTGVAVVEQDNDLGYASDSMSRVAPGGEYPNVSVGGGASSFFKIGKSGFGTWVTDEMVAHANFPALARALEKMTNTTVRDHDQAILSAVGSAVTRSIAVRSGAWSNKTTSDPFDDLSHAAATLEEAEDGIRIDTWVMKPTKYADLISNVGLRTRIDGIETSGNVTTIAGFGRFLRTVHMPPGIEVLGLSSTQIGGIAYEDLGGGWSGPADGIQTKFLRKDDTDSGRVLMRNTRKPIIQNPQAGLILTGA